MSGRRYPEPATSPGAAATLQDIKDCNAVLVASNGDTAVSKPLTITVPQYAYWRDQGGRRIRVIVVQAEEAKGVHIFGVRDANGKDIACTEAELTLLGTAPPS
jgi:hypothetical protein